jgi:hypothetical protein
MGGAQLPAVNGLLELQTWHDYAATIGVLAGGTRYAILVVRISDGRLWTIKPRPGANVVRLLAVSYTDVVVGENDDVPGVPAYQMQRLTRYQLSRLDDLASAW